MRRPHKAGGEASPVIPRFACALGGLRYAQCEGMQWRHRRTVEGGQDTLGMDQTHHPPGPVEQEYHHERRDLVTAPVACYFALLVGVTMPPLGVLGFIPWLTPGGALFGLLRVTPVANIIHLVTGLAGLAVLQTKNGTHAPASPLGT